MLKKFKYKLIVDMEEKLEGSNKNNNGIIHERNTIGISVLRKLMCGCFFLIIVVMYKIASFEIQTTVNAVRPEAEIEQKSSTNKTFMQEYFVHTNQCVIPYVNPFSTALLKIYKRPKENICPKGDVLINSVYDQNSQKYLLQINDTIRSKIVLKSKEDFKCCYHEIKRAGGSGGRADKQYKLLPCVDFQHNFAVPRHINGLITRCTLQLRKKMIYEDAFSFIQYQSNNSNANNSLTVNRTKPNVLLIGIDSLSRINFRRTMPKTFAHLVSNRWFELEGYNKIGDNTFPNLMALLTGLNQPTANKICKPKTLNGLNNCDFIWNHYKNSTYRTSYAEDVTAFSTFNYMVKGFKNPPTDHYLRPFLLAIEKKLKVVSKFRFPYCIGHRQYGEYIYDNALEFAKRYCNRNPFFGLYWTNSFSHNRYDAPGTMDTKMRDYLLAFERNHILDTTIVFFFSDHGSRWGPLLKLASGYLEERLPMFFIWLPEWFRKKYPEFVRALDINRHRLSSPFDIYLTLQHILAIGNDENSTSNKFNQTLNSCPKCQSIFHEISANRTCADAGIIEHWCTCASYDMMNKNEAIFANVTNLIIAEMNNYFVHNNITQLCRKITLKSVDSAEKLTQNSNNQKLKKDKNSTADGVYRIKFTISQKLAKFQATASYNGSKNRVQLDVEKEISRLNTYANDSKCIDDKEAKKFCICMN